MAQVKNDKVSVKHETHDMYQIKKFCLKNYEQLP